MGNKVYTSQLRATFEQLIYKEDYKGFFKALERVATSSDLWPLLQIRSVDLLSRQGLTWKAIGKARELKNSLTDPVLRKKAELKYLFLETAINQNASGSSLEKECFATLTNPDFEALRFFVKGILLRWKATELMLGLSDAESKRTVIRSYLKQITMCLQSKCQEEAYEFTTELIHLLLTRPFPTVDKALEYLHYFRSRPFITQAHHRLAFINLQIAEIGLEQHLKEATTNGYEEFYELAAESYRKAGNSLGQAHIQKSKGSILLKYGRAAGRKMLHTAIRSFEAADYIVPVLYMQNAIVKWLETQGAHSAINSYRIKTNALTEELGLHSLKNKIRPAIHLKRDSNDLLENTRKLMALTNRPVKSGDNDKHKHLVNNLIKRIAKRGKTIHLARALAAANTSITPGSANSRSAVIKLYTELGYPLEAVDLIREDLISGLRIPNPFSFNADFSEELVKSVGQIESILCNYPDLESREKLAKSYQLVAYLWTISGLPENGIDMLKKSEALLKRHNLAFSQAFNDLYMGSVLLDLSNDNNPGSLKAFYHFSEANALFRLMHNHEGIWRSQFGMALSAHRQILDASGKSALLIQNCSEHYLRAIQIVHHMTVHHQKTESRFGESFVFSTRLQKGADQLYASAIDYFVNIACDPEVTDSLLDKKQTWTLLNRNHPKVKMN